MPLIQLALDDDGRAILKATVGISEPKQAEMIAAARPIPAIVVLNLLVDTGAARTGLDPEAVSSLDLEKIAAVTGDEDGPGLYEVSLAIYPHEGAPFFVPDLRVTQDAHRASGVDGVLGRDVLSKCVFVYDGHLGGFTLSFRPQVFS